MGIKGASVCRPPSAPARSTEPVRERETPLTTFTADASSALGGPDWLVRRRAEAWQRFAASNIPTEAEEVWRYSGIDAFDLEAFAPAPRASGEHSGPQLAVARRLADSLGPRAGLVVTRNGVVDAVEISTASSSDALVVTGATDASSPVPVPETLGELSHARDAFGELHDAFLADVVRISVARKAVFADPVVVVHLVEPERGAAQGVALFPRLLVEFG